MGQSIYEEALGQASGTRPTDSIYDEALRNQTSDQETVLRQTMQQIAKRPPAQAARVNELAQKLELPASVIEANLPAMEERAKLDDTEVSRLIRQAPRTSAWAVEQPQHAAVLQDQIEQLALTEKRLTFLQSIQRGIDTTHSMLFGAVEATGELLESERVAQFGRAGRRLVDREIGRGTQRSEFSQIRDFTDFAQWAKETVGEQIPIMTPMIAGGAAGAAVGSVVPGVGTTIGGIVGAFIPGAAMGVGEVQGAIKARGEGNQAPAAAFIGGAAVAALDTVLPGKIGGRLARTFGLEAAEQIAARVLTSQVRKSALVQTAKGVVTGMATEGVTEAIQEAVGEYTASLGTDTPMSPDIWKQMLEAGAAGAFFGGVVETATAAIEAPTQRRQRQAAEALHKAGILTTLGAELAATEGGKLSPAAIESYMQAISKDGPAGRVYWPSDAFTEYWQGKKQDPAEIAQLLTGDPKAYELAVQTGQDLEIPMARYASTIAATEHNAEAAQVIRFEPGTMNAREAAAFSETLNTITRATEPATTEESEVSSDIVAQLVRGGMDPETAQTHADLYRDVMGSMGGRAAVNPLELYNRYGLKVDRPGITPGTTPPATAGTAAAVSTPGPVAPLMPEELGKLERRATAGEGPGGVERRAAEPSAIEADPFAALRSAGVLDPDAEIDATNVGEAALRMMREDPSIVQRAKELQARGEAAKRELPSHPREEGDTAAGDTPATPQTFIGRVREGAGYGATVGQFSEGNRLQLLVRRGGGYFWGERSEGTDRATGELVAEGAFADETPAEFATAAEARAAAQATPLPGQQVDSGAETPVDAAQPGEETPTDDTGAAGLRPGTREGGRPSISRIEASTPLSRRESATAREARRRKHYASIFSELKRAALELVPDADVKAIRKEFNDRIALLEDLDVEYQNSGHNPRKVLEAIAAAGGISVDFEERRGGLGGELRWVKDSAQLGPFGAFAGVRGVFQAHQTQTPGRRRSGLSLDEMTTSLKSQPEFSWIQDQSDLFQVLEDVARLTEPLPRTTYFPGTEELRRRAGMDPARDWWRPGNEQEFFQQTTPATRQELEALENQIKEAEPALTEFDLRALPSGAVQLETIATTRTGTGIGTRAMQMLTAWADAEGRRLELSLAEKGYQPIEGGPKTSSKSRLADFYKRFGFVENKGRNKRFDFSIYTSMYREPSRTTYRQDVDPAARQAELEALATDEAMGVEFQDDEPSHFPDGSAAVVCTNCAERMIELAGNGEVYGWEEGTNPSSVVAGPEQGAQTDTGQGHDFAVIDGRYLVDAWAKNVEMSAPRAVFDMLNPTDRQEIARLYGDPSSWMRRTEDGFVKDVPAALTQPIADTLDTGETQPRLPGAEAVRDAEVPTPELEAPFSLTSPVSKAKGKQETLFQEAVQAPIAQLQARGFTIRPYYHQTAAVNVEPIKEQGFDLSKGRARLTDEQVPDGVFFKPFPNDIKVGASGLPGDEAAQIPVYIRFGNTRYFEDRAALSAFLKRDEAYRLLAEETTRYEQEQAKLFDEKWNRLRELDRGMDTYAQERADLEIDKFMEDWKRGDEERATAARARATEVLKGLGVETVVIQKDAGSMGRSTETVIAIAGNQVALAEPDDQRILFQPAYHGSPHKFDRFSLHAIGSGEGNQAYGWGLYFASVRDVAEGYRERLAGSMDFSVEGGGRLPDWVGRRLSSPDATAGPGSRTHAAELEQLLTDFKARVVETERLAQDKQGAYWNYEDILPGLRAVVHGLENVKKGAKIEQPGRVFKVEIPEDEDFLAWDEPASNQSPKVQAALRELGVTWAPFVYPTLEEAIEHLEGKLGGYRSTNDDGWGDLLARERDDALEGIFLARSGNERAFRRWFDAEYERFGFKQGINPLGASIYADLQAEATRERKKEAGVWAVDIGQDSARRASEKLASVGIAGIRYLDGFSRGAGRGSSNYVVVDDSLIEVQEFYQLEGFYSRLERAVETAKQNKANGAQWKAMIRNSKEGINLEEFALASVDDLEDGKSYTKEEVLQYLEANRVTVEPVTLSHAGEDEQAIRRRADRIYERMQEEDDHDLDEEVERYLPDYDIERVTIEAEPELLVDDNGDPILDDDGEEQYTTPEPEEVWRVTIDDEDQGDYQTRIAAQAAVDNELDDRREQLRQDRGEDFEGKADYDEALREARKDIGVQGGIAQYGDYVEPGQPEAPSLDDDDDDDARTREGDPTYREVFLTVPKLKAAVRVPVTLAKVVQVRQGENIGPDASGRTKWEVWLKGSGVDSERPWVHVWAENEAKAKEDAQEYVDAAEFRAANAEKSATKWSDGHDLYRRVPNPIVRLRFNERIDTEGRKVLFLEEVQPPAPREQHKEPALFTKNWREIGFKWALQHAVEIGADVVAWTTGQMQADRYNLSRVVGRIEHSKQGTIDARATTPGDTPSRFVVIHLTDNNRPGYLQFYVDTEGPARGKITNVQGALTHLEGEQLSEAIGPELAEQILTSTEEGIQTIKDKDLNIGGKGLAKLYDVDFRNVVNKLPAVRKRGEGVTAVQIPFGEITQTLTEAERNELRDTGDWQRHAELRAKVAAKVPNVKTVPAVVITPELKAQIQEHGQALFQDQQDRQDMPDARGSISFGKDRQFTINLFAKANLSTFLHESGHFFLEMFGDLADELRPMGERTPEQARLLSDYDAVLAWLGVDDRTKLTRKQHEKFARGFEAYLREGKAPSLSLRAAFARFRSWLMAIYRNVSQLDVEITPEIREVFDRMVATDQAIEEARAEADVKPLFTTPESAGMRPEQFALYAAHVAEAGLRQRETLERKLLAELGRARTREWQRAREDVKVGVLADVYQRPVYLALSALQKGTYPDGTPMGSEDQEPPPKISRESIVREFGKDRLKKLPRPYVYQVDGGLEASTLAELYGYSSADEFLTALEQAPPMQQEIDRLVDQRMMQEYGSILLDGTIHEEAIKAAYASDARESVVKAELRALAELRRVVAPHVAEGVGRERRNSAYERRWLEAEARLRVAMAEGRKQVEIDALQQEVDNLKRKAAGGPQAIAAAIPPADFIRNRAQERIAATQVRNIRPALFWSAARQASDKATAAAARQDFDAAILAKQQELFNLALFRAANQALDDVEARVQRAKELAKGSRRALVGQAGKSYLEQIDGILSDYEFADVPAKQLERRSSLVKWVAAQEGAGLAVDMPAEVLDEARKVNYRELSYEELVGVTDGLAHIAHLARLKRRLLKNKEARELNETAASIATSILEKTTRRKPRTISTRTPKEERVRMLDGVFAAHRKMSSLAYELDGFADGGAFWEHVIRPLNEAGDREATMIADATKKLSKLFNEAYPGKEQATLYQKRMIPAIGQSLAKMNAIMVGLNWGNAGNRQRLQSGYKWTDAQVQAVLDTLDAKDWKFIQGVWDFIEEFWPEIAAKQERVYGIAPKKVEALSFQTPYGTMRGGYFPLKGDEQLSARTGELLDVESASLAKHAAYVNATTRRNHTKERVEKASYPVRLDFGVIFEHTIQVVHDLSHHEALIDVGRILGHKSVQDAIYTTHGDLVYRQFKNGVRDVAFGDVPASNAFERGINHLRAGTTVATLGWSLATTMLQPIGLTQSVVRIGAKWVGRGMKRWTRDAVHLENTVAWVTGKSEFMRNRFRTQQREINEIRNQLGVNTGKLAGYVDEVLSKTTFDTVTRQGVADSFFWMIAVAQRVVDVPTWLGAYEKAMEAGQDEETAVHIADQAVLDSQAGGQVKDLASVQRGGPMMRLWTNFYSFFSTTYNLAAESRRKRHGKLKNPAEVGRMAADYMMLFMLPASLGYMVGGLMGRNDDDEDWLSGLLKANVSYLMGTMLGLRELSGAVSGYDYSGPAGTRFFSSATRLYKQAEQGELDEAFWRALNETAGAVFHYPAGQVRRTLEGAAALADGTTDNPGALVVGAPKD